MSVPATASEKLVSLSEILGAAASWVAAGSDATDVYWPELAGSYVFGANPVAVIYLEDARTAIVELYSDGAQYGEDDLQSLADSLRFELPTRYRTDGTGLFINVDPQPSDFMEPNLGEEAFKGTEIIHLTMTLAIGVDQEA